MIARARLKLVAIVALFAAPIAASFVAFHFFRPEATSNYGELIRPPQPVTSAQLRRVGGGDFAFSQLRGKWVLVASDSGACPASCTAKLTMMRQVRLMLGRNAGRLERVFVADDTVPLAAEALAAFEGTVAITPPSGMTLPLARPGGAELIDQVRARIQSNGAMRGSEFDYDGPKRGGWWDWKPAKEAVEYLYSTGELMVSDRVNFQRVYDLTERVLPDWVDQRPPSVEERDRHWVELGLKALGASTPAQAGAYTFRTLTVTRKMVEQLRQDGAVQTVQARLVDGKIQKCSCTGKTCLCSSRPRREASLPGARPSSARSTACSGRRAGIWNCGDSANRWKPTRPTRPTRPGSDPGTSHSELPNSPSAAPTTGAAAATPFASPPPAAGPRR